jgi:DNA processing protein
MGNLSYWLALNLVPDLGAVGARKLLARFESIEGVFDNLGQLEECRWLRQSQVKALQKMPSRMSQIEEYLLDIEDHGIQILTIESDDYPENLRPLPDAPLLLYVAGSRQPEDNLAVAIVGTRTPTPEGEKMAYDLASELARRGVTVVSGLAMGIDTAAHVGALEGGGRTIAVLGSGLYRLTPWSNRELWGEIRERGAVVSEYPPHQGVSATRLMMRNRIQAGLSLGVLVVEAREKGGALVTARHARRYGRHLFAVKWPEEKEEAEGTNALITEQGATPLERPEEAEKVLEILTSPPQAPSSEQKLPV